MEVKIKNLDRREWYTDSDRDFECVYIKDDFFEGGLGLISFTGIKGPDEVVTPDGRRLCIADKGYQWLEIAPKGKNYVITSMLHGDEIFQHYVDITLRNEIAKNGDAVFYDLFLDVVFEGDSEPLVIDTEELEEALSEGTINNEQFVLAQNAADEVIDFFSTNRDLLEKKLLEYRDNYF